jgi:hypothetical protein
VNNLRRQSVKIIHLTTGLALFTGRSQAHPGEQAVDINSLSVFQSALRCPQFIERTKQAVTVQKIVTVCFQDNPRRLGKGRVRLVGPVPLKPDRKIRTEAAFTGSSGMFANAKSE